MANFLRVLVLIVIAFATPLAAWAQAINTVIVTLVQGRDSPNGTDMTFTFTIDPNGPAPAFEATLVHPVKSTKASYLTAIRNKVKAEILALTGDTLQNSDIIIWPLLE